jgi:hypothetical protein
MCKYAAFKSQDDASITAIPVFPSQFFRQSSLYVQTDSTLTKVSELAGKRIGIPEWVQAGVNDPGRVIKILMRWKTNFHLAIVMPTLHDIHRLQQFLLPESLSNLTTAIFYFWPC